MATQTTYTLIAPASAQVTLSRKRKGDGGDENNGPAPKKFRPGNLPAALNASLICDFCANHPEGQAAHAVTPCNRNYHYSNLLECQNCANYRARHRNSDDKKKAKHACKPVDGTLIGERIYADSDPVAPPPAVCDHCHKRGFDQTCDVDTLLEFGCSHCVVNTTIKECKVGGKAMDKRPSVRNGDPRWFRHACDTCVGDVRHAEIPCTWLNDRSTWDRRCNRCTSDNRICLESSHFVADIHQPMGLPDTWEIHATDDVPYFNALSTSLFRQCCKACSSVRLKCQVSSKTPHHACERCTQLGIDCLGPRNEFYPIYDLSRVGFGGSQTFQICRQCYENGRNCDHQRPCDSCVTTGNRNVCDPYDGKKKHSSANETTTYNCCPRFTTPPGILYYLAMGYGPGGVTDRKSGSRIEEWIGPLASIYGSANAKFLTNPTEQAARLARNAAQPLGNPPHGGPGGRLANVRPSAVTPQQLADILRAANPWIVPPTAQQIADAGRSNALDESRTLATAWVENTGRTPRLVRRSRREAAPLTSAVCPPRAPSLTSSAPQTPGIPFPTPYPFATPGQFAPQTALYQAAPGQAPCIHGPATYLTNLLAQPVDPTLRAIVQQEMLEERQQREAQEAQRQAQEAAAAPPPAQLGYGDQSHVRAPSQNTQTAQNNPFGLRMYAPTIARPAIPPAADPQATWGLNVPPASVPSYTSPYPPMIARPRFPPPADPQDIWGPNVPPAYVPNNLGYTTPSIPPPGQPYHHLPQPTRGTSRFGEEGPVAHDNFDLPQQLVDSMLALGQHLQSEDTRNFENIENFQPMPVPPGINQNDPRNDVSFSQMMQDAPNFMDNGNANVDPALTALYEQALNNNAPVVQEEAPQNVQNAQGAEIDPDFVPFNDVDIWTGTGLFEDVPAQAPQTTQALPIDPALQAPYEDPNINSGLLQGNNPDQVMSNNVEDADGPAPVSTNLALNPFIGIDVTTTPDYRHPQLLTRWRDANRLEGLDMRHWQTDITADAESSRLFGTVAGQPVADAPCRDIVKDIPLQKDNTTINHEEMNFCMEPGEKGLGVCFKNVPDLTGCQSTKHRNGRPPSHFLVCDDCNDESTDALVKGENPITAKDIISLRAYLCTPCASHCGASPQNMSALRAAGAARVWGQYRNGEAPDGVFALPGGEIIEYKRNELPATGCACATKVFDRRLCRFHRLFYAEQSLQQAALMQEWRLNRFGKAVCPACLLTKAAQDANVSADQDGFEESAVTAWACLSCNDWVVNQDNDSEAKPQVVPGYWREGTVNAQELFVKEDQPAGLDFDEEMADVFDM